MNAWFIRTSSAPSILPVSTYKGKADTEATIDHLFARAQRASKKLKDGSPDAEG